MRLEGDFTPTERGFTCPNCGATAIPRQVDVSSGPVVGLGKSASSSDGYRSSQEISARVKHMNGLTIKFSGNENWD